MCQFEHLHIGPASFNLHKLTLEFPVDGVVALLEDFVVLGEEVVDAGNDTFLGVLGRGGILAHYF